MSACSGPCSERACAALAVEAESSPVGCSRSMERAELDARQRIILVGDNELVAATYRELVSAGCAVTCVPAADADNELPSRLEDAATLVIATRQDALVLRLVLLAADLRPDLPRVVTVFDRTLAERLRQGRLACTVVSSAEIVAGAVAGPCVDPSVDALRRVGRDIEEIRVGADPVRRRHTRRAQERIAHAFDHAVGVLRPFDTSARILVAGIAGLLAMLLTDLVVGIAFLHEGFVDALLLATRTLATVAANDAVARASPAIRVASVITMIGTIASIAIFSAGLVSRLVEPRHLGIVGRRALPHRDHVVIVGMGQIGLRTALLLRAAGMRVVGVDRDPSAIGVRLGIRLGLPIVIASGEDRELLKRLGAQRARCVAAVTSDDLANIAIAIAARDLAPRGRMVLRAGDGDIARETRSLLELGVVRDAHRLVAIGLAAATLGARPDLVVLCEDDTAFVVDHGGRTVPWSM